MLVVMVWRGPRLWVEEEGEGSTGVEGSTEGLLMEEKHRPLKLIFEYPLTILTLLRWTVVAEEGVVLLLGQ